MSGMLRIVKVGGSLFSLPDLAQRLKLWLGKQPAGISVLLAGGGSLVEAVRQWDERFQLGQEASHWMCVELLDTTAKLLRQLLPEARLCRTVEDIGARGKTSRELIFAPSRFLHEDEPHCAGDKLPRTWEVTSDSIAARLAEVALADELVLLKSALPDAGCSVAELSGSYVDNYFAAAVRRLPGARFVDLRSPQFSEVAVRL